MPHSHAQLVTEAQSRLATAASALAAVFGPARHDLWTGDQFNVAPTRIDEARRLRTVSPDKWTNHDLDYVMFKCMTTMGDEPTYRFILPRFLAAFAACPYDGWTSEAHVQTSKVKLLELTSWSDTEIAELSAALNAFADLELAMEKQHHLEEEWYEPATDDAVALLETVAVMLGRQPARK